MDSINRRCLTILAGIFLSLICCDERPQIASGSFGFLKENFEGTSLERISEVEKYPAESLWIYIDGAADLYLKHNVLEMAAAYYAVDETEINAEIYRFDDSINASRMFHTIRPSKAVAVKFGDEGFKSASSIEFVRGHYLIRLIGYDSDVQTTMAIDDLAEVLDKLIQNNSSIRD